MTFQVTGLARLELGATPKQQRELKQRLVKGFVEQLGEALKAGVSPQDFHRLWRDAATTGNHSAAFQREVIAESEAEVNRCLQG